MAGGEAKTAGLLEMQWRTYAAAIFQGAKVPTVQHRETKLAFFAGMQHMLAIMDRVGQLAEPEAMALMSQVTGEMAAFLARIEAASHHGLGMGWDAAVMDPAPAVAPGGKPGAQGN